MNHKSIYIASAEPRAGTLIISIGIMEMLKGRYEKVAFFRPIIADGDEIDNNIDFMLKHFELKMTYDACCGFTVGEYIEAYGTNTQDKLHESLIRKVKKLYKEYDFVLIEGYPRNAFSSVFEFDINLEIAKNLNTVFMPVIHAKGKSSNKIVNEIQILSEMVKAEGCAHLATFVNRCNESIIENIKKRISSKQIEEQIYILPEVKELNTPTLDQITKVLHAKMIMGEKEQLQHLVHGNKIAAMGVENYLSHIDNGDIVIVPGDRIDIIIISLLSFYAKNHTNITGIILSGGLSLSEPIMKLLEDFSETVIPIFTVDSYSYETAIALDKIPASITTESTRKITLAKGMINAVIDKEKMGERFRASSHTTLTPIMFQYRLFEQARSDRQKIVLPESNDERILRATEILIRRDIVDIILLGNPKVIEKQCMQMDLDISKAEIIDPQESPLSEKFSQLFYEMRKEKGLTLDVARDAMTHVNYFATMMVYEGLADGMVSGATHTTADTVRPALQIIKTKADISIVSSIFFMCLDTKVLVYGDCAVNMDPTAQQLAQIAVSSADTAKAFGIEPKVALLSYSTGASGTGPEVEKVREATKLAQTMRPEYLIEGPIQYDAAIDAKVAKKKLPNSKVAGKATVFIFPDLNTGNNTYKAVQRSTGALAIGPVLQGLRLPVNDLSRGCLVDDIVNTVAITAIQAQQGEKK
jgi:phosphate acetyltransferase